MSKTEIAGRAGPWLVPASRFMNRPDPTWLIEDVIPEGGLAVLYGSPGTGKSFLALDWACRVATGLSWDEASVLPGRSAYIAAEGGYGLKARLAAWTRWNEQDVAKTENLMISHPVNLFQTTDLSSFIPEVAEYFGGEVGLVVVDTLARSMVGGDDNLAKDMGRVIASLDDIRSSGATVLVVHHSSKTGKTGLRGSSALLGAVDTSIELVAQKRGLFLHCKKQRDGAEFATRRLVMNEVEPSCVVTVLGCEGDGATTVREAELDLLKTLAAYGDTGPTWSTIREVTELAKSTLHRRLDRLKEAGLVTSDGGQWAATLAGFRLVRGPFAGREEGGEAVCGS